MDIQETACPPPCVHLPGPPPPRAPPPSLPQLILLLTGDPPLPSLGLSRGPRSGRLPQGGRGAENSSPFRPVQGWVSRVEGLSCQGHVLRNEEAATLSREGGETARLQSGSHCARGPVFPVGRFSLRGNNSNKNNGSQRPYNMCHEPGAILRTVHALTLLFFITARQYHHPLLQMGKPRHSESPGQGHTLARVRGRT